MRLEARKYLFDIRKAAELLARFSADKTFDEYTRDPLLKSAVERQFEIIGEALGQVLKVQPALADRVSQCRRIIAFRNILIHGYASISDDVVWDVLKHDLPVLRQEVEGLLKDTNAS